MIKSISDAGKNDTYDAVDNRIKSSYLVTCPKIKALEGYATKFLLSLYCETKQACMTCSGCKKILSENSPDVHKIYPESGMIKIGMIRDLNKFLSEKPFESAYKTVIIYEGDKMNPSAQNALLKPLEQPPDNTVFLILSQSDFGILPTVISRCESIRLIKSKEENALLSLKKSGADEERAKLALSLAYGYLEEAAELVFDEEYFDLRKKTIENLYRLLDQKTYAISFFVDFLVENKEEFSIILDIIKLMMMDVLKAKLTGKKDLIVNIDQRDDITVKSLSFTTGAIYNMMEKLLEFEQRMKFNINFKLCVESMLFEILKEKYRWLES